jgi:trans-aconitate methyltransferase
MTHRWLEHLTFGSGIRSSTNWANESFCQHQRRTIFYSEAAVQYSTLHSRIKVILVTHRWLEHLTFGSGIRSSTNWANESLHLYPNVTYMNQHICFSWGKVQSQDDWHVEKVRNETGALEQRKHTKSSGMEVSSAHSTVRNHKLAHSMAILRWCTCTGKPTYLCMLDQLWLLFLCVPLVTRRLL